MFMRSTERVDCRTGYSRYADDNCLYSLAVRAGRVGVGRIPITGCGCQFVKLKISWSLFK